MELIGVVGEIKILEDGGPGAVESSDDPATAVIDESKGL